MKMCNEIVILLIWNNIININNMCINVCNINVCVMIIIMKY